MTALRYLVYAWAGTTLLMAWAVFCAWLRIRGERLADEGAEMLARERSER